MIQRLKKHQRFKETLLLGSISIFCLLLCLFRMFWTDQITYFFLNWNLFLAFVPWLFSSLMIIFPRFQKKPILVLMLLGAWLLFFPNAPYILTDLFHLQWSQHTMPLWFDLTLVMSYAWVGLLFGFTSLMDAEKVVANYLPKKLIPVMSTVLLFLGSFGIYLGRYLRWNSWDIIQEPMTLLYDVGDRFVNPIEHPRTWGVTIFMGLMLNMMYWSFRLLRSK
jgi:uncharacterized membrane protein